MSKKQNIKDARLEIDNLVAMVQDFDKVKQQRVLRSNYEGLKEHLKKTLVTIESGELIQMVMV